jgi:hypothetical protein
MSALLVLVLAVVVPLALYLWRPRRVEAIVDRVTSVTQVFWLAVVTLAALVSIWTGVLVYMLTGAVVIAIVTIVVVSQTDLLDRADVPFL